MFQEFSFLTEEEKRILCLLSNAKINYKDIKSLSPKKLDIFLSKYIKEIKKINKKSTYNIERVVGFEDVDTIFRFRKYNINTKNIIKKLKPLLSIKICKYPNTNEILRKTNRKYAYSKLCNLVIIVISVAVFIYEGYSLNVWKVDNNELKKISASVIENTKTEEVKPIEEEFLVDNYEKFLNYSLLDVEFDKLIIENSDTKGWLKVKGTNINYPFVKAQDNEYYLKHSFDKSTNEKGWIFLDYRNNIDNPDKNNIIYAHGLVNNMMLGSLRNVFKTEWLNNEENRVISISTQKSKQLWQVFSTYKIEPEDYYITTNFNDIDFSEFINVLVKRSEYDYNVNINSNDKILTLSSCYDNTRRMVLHAKLIYYSEQ